MNDMMPIDKSQTVLSPLSAAIAEANRDSFQLNDNGELVLDNVRTLYGRAHVNVTKERARELMVEFLYSAVEVDAEALKGQPIVIKDAKSICKLACLGFNFPGAKMYRAMTGQEEQQEQTHSLTR